MQSRLLLSGLIALTILPLSACSSDATTKVTSVDYLALGDSVAYGDNGFIDHTAAARPNAAAFVGYPDLLGSESFGGRYVNLGCPGATTASFSSLTVTDNGCRAIQTDAPSILHVSYTSTQADKADEYLSASDVKVITLSLGGNDLLLTLAACTAQTPDDASQVLGCALKQLPTTLQVGAANLGALFQHLKDRGFKGQLVYVNVYSSYPTTATTTLAIKQWDDQMQPIVMAAGGTVADVFTAFASVATASGDGDPCAAGLLIPNPVAGGTPACDIHPTEMGARLLADTVKVALTL